MKDANAMPTPSGTRTEHSASNAHQGSISQPMVSASPVLLPALSVSQRVRALSATLGTLFRGSAVGRSVGTGSGWPMIKIDVMMGMLWVGMDARRSAELKMGSSVRVAAQFHRIFVTRSLL